MRAAENLRRFTVSLVVRVSACVRGSSAAKLRPSRVFSGGCTRSVDGTVLLRCGMTPQGHWVHDSLEGIASAFAGHRSPPDVISVAVRWYLRYGLSYRDVEELLAERGMTVDHVTINRWVRRFTLQFVWTARTRRRVCPATGGSSTRHT